MNNTQTRLHRTLNTSDAVIIGLGSMIGAGIFTAAIPAAQAAGTGLLIGVIIAGLLAYLNATTMAQLASVYPESGGAYVYGRKMLGDYWGFLAGWGFIIGKLASCTAMALTFAYYASPQYAQVLAVVAVLTLTIINYLGVKKTAQATKVIITLVILSLITVIFTSLLGGGADISRLTGWTTQGGYRGILEASGMMFFAFAGYARIATLGEEVINPQKTIPKAVIIALGITLFIYLSIMTVVLVCVDINRLIDSKAPLALAMESGTFAQFSPIVRIGACLASLGVLLSLMAGVSRTIFAMASNTELPKSLSSVHKTNKTPHRAELFVGTIVAIIVAFADLRMAIGFSSFAILTYYAIANLSALKLKREQRLWPKWMSFLGLVACITISFSLPQKSVIAGLFMFALGTSIYHIQKKRKDRKAAMRA